MRCDSFGSEVVWAAEQATASRDLRCVLYLVEADDEALLRRRFEEAIAAPPQRDAHRRFLETVVERHRAAEGLPYRGIQPPGGVAHPVVAITDRALESGVASALIGMFPPRHRADVASRFQELAALRQRVDGSLVARRAYALGRHRFITWAASVVPF